jgi:hypothetical protein
MGSAGVKKNARMRSIAPNIGVKPWPNFDDDAKAELSNARPLLQYS